MDFSVKLSKKQENDLFLLAEKGLSYEESLKIVTSLKALSKLEKNKVLSSATRSTRALTVFEERILRSSASEFFPREWDSLSRAEKILLAEFYEALRARLTVERSTGTDAERREGGALRRDRVSPKIVNPHRKELPAQAPRAPRCTNCMAVLRANAPVYKNPSENKGLCARCYMNLKDKTGYKDESVVD